MAIRSLDPGISSGDASYIAFDGTNISSFLTNSNAKVIDSIAALRNISKTKYTKVFVTGYYAAGDGGGGMYWYDSSDTTSTDNGGTIIVGADGGRWKLSYNGTVDIKQFGARCDGTNDFAYINAALSACSNAVVPCGATACVSTVTMPAGSALINNGTIKKLAGTTTPTIILDNNCSVTKGTIDGNSVVCDGIFASEKSNCKVDGVYLHDVGGKGITFYTSGSNISITNNRLTNITGQAINVEYLQDVRITNNEIDTALHGIQWWGGDSNVSQTVGTSNITISSNNVKNVMGGIWGSLASNISVTNNTVKNCSDVGIDFEGGYNFTCTGNSASECANGCYGLFYGVSQGTFSGNSALNSTATGAGLYVYTNSTYAINRISIVGNNFSVKGHAIYSGNLAGLGLSNSIISSNHFLTTTGVSSIAIYESTNLLITDNHTTTVGSPVGFELQGVSNSVIRDNSLFGFSDISSAPGAAGGIWLYAKSSSYPSQSNIVRGNRVDSYNYSIVDNCTIDVTKSKNDIEHNHVTNIYRSVGASYNGVIANNINMSTPATSVSAATF